MNRRVLKKKSKQAIYFIEKYYRNSVDKIFPAEKGDNYHGLVLRCTCHSKRASLSKCGHHYHPLKGTPMTGGMSGYYEPEWYEKTAYEVLQDLVIWGERAAGITDREWKMMLKITATTEEQIKNHLDWIKQGQ